MSRVKEHMGFIVGSKVICILNNRATLTVGKEYNIESMEVYPSNQHDDFWICVKNDSGLYVDYHYTRFINKNEFRSHLINEIIE